MTRSRASAKQAGARFERAIADALATPDPCVICRRQPATVFRLCPRCLPRAVWFIDPPWSD